MYIVYVSKLRGHLENGPWTTLLREVQWKLCCISYLLRSLKYFHDFISNAFEKSIGFEIRGELRLESVVSTVWQYVYIKRNNCFGNPFKNGSKTKNYLDLSDLINKFN